MRDVWIGLHWTAVVLADGRAGMASTLVTSQRSHGSPDVREAGALHTLSARDLSAYVRTGRGPEVSIGWAALNALVTPPLGSAPHGEIDALDFLIEHGAGRRVALVGRFPFVRQLGAHVRELWVFELDPAEGEFSARDVPALFPQADLIAITSMSLVNGTFEDLIAHRRPGTPTIMLGPSTPLSPALFAWGVDALFGIQVRDVDALRRCVSQGATFQQMQGVQKVTIVHPDSGIELR